ncbi:MAG: hypothetical protein KIS30_05915 [Thermoplasmata archaeon]|nr:hypothetical protein [Candidatus Sysuiplasma acidicola]MBX8646275.1 hypothetical protein [Candidatus Sysuiplasma acidicola]
MATQTRSSGSSYRAFVVTTGLITVLSVLSVLVTSSILNSHVMISSGTGIYFGSLRQVGGTGYIFTGIGPVTSIVLDATLSIILPLLLLTLFIVWTKKHGETQGSGADN